MSDQHATPSDRRAVARSRKGSANRLRGDLSTTPVDLLRGVLLAAWATCAACVAPHPPIAPPPARVEVWVDAYAQPGGDGSATRPHKTVSKSLPKSATVHLASGVYHGPFVLPEDVELIGTGVVVLALEGAGHVVELGDGRLVNLSIQGGETGLVSRGHLRLEGVRFSGFSRVGLQAEQGSKTSCTRCEVDGTIAGAVGMAVMHASLRLADSRFSGGLVRAVDVQQGEVTLERTAARGPRTLLRATDAVVQLVDVSAEGGTASAVVVSGGSLSVRALTVVGHEYSLLATRSAVNVEGLSSTGALCGVSLQDVHGTLTHVRVSRSGSQGALVLLNSDVSIDDLDVQDARAWGVLVRKGRAQLKRVRISQVAREGGTPADPELGDGLQLRDAQVALDDVIIRDTEGSALYASNFAKVSLTTLVAERTGAASVVVDVSAEVDAQLITLRSAHGPGLLLLNGGHARVGRLDASGVDVPTWTDCAHDAFVEVTHLSGVEVAPARCEKLGR